MHWFGYFLIVSDSDSSIRGRDVHMLFLDGVGLLSKDDLLQVPFLREKEPRCAFVCIGAQAIVYTHVYICACR